MLERKSKNREEKKLIDFPRRSPRLHYEIQINAQSPRTPKPAETRRGRPDSLSTPLTKIKKTSHGVLENGEGKGTQSNSEKSRNGCRRSARTHPGLEKQSAKRKPQTRSTVGGCGSVNGLEDSAGGSRRSERRDRGANVGKRGEVVIEKRVTRSSVRRNKVVVHVISDSDSEEDSGGSRVVVSEERKNNVGVDKEKNAGEFEKRATRSSCRTCMKKASKVPCSNNEVSDPDWEEDSDVSKYWKNKVGVDKEKKVGEFEKRATRSSGKTCMKKVSNVSCSNNEYSESDSDEDSGGSPVVASKERKNKVGVDKGKDVGEFEKRAPQRPSKTSIKKDTNVSNTSRPKAVISDEVEPKGDDELLKVDTSKKTVKDCGVVRRNGGQDCARKERIGDKRKRDGIVEECDTAQGWSKEQEFALQRAYFTAKPTPQFWKKVSRMVPGKSAEECFDRIHSDHITPPQPRTRSRAKIKDPSPLSFSASKLLSPAATKTKRVGFKRKTLLAQKTVRHILQKQQKEDQDYNADLFAVLEPTISPVPLQEGASFLSPPLNKTAPFLTGCMQRSSSSQKKHVSRIGSLQKAAFTSPPVLKQIKNKALHEKYIDQLHCRDAKRKAEALRNSRNAKDQIDEKVNHLKQNLVKVAKNALVSDAQDAISKFQSLFYRDGDDDSTNCSGDDGDDEDEENDGV